MPSIFDAVYEAIQQEINKFTWRVGRASAEEEIQQAIREIQKAYCPGGLESDRATLLDFCWPAARIAYMFQFTTSHINVVANALLRLKSMDSWLAHLQRRKFVNVCAVGGGPGTDILGVFRFLRHCYYNGMFHATILDWCPDWSFSFRPMAECMDPCGLFGLSSSTVYQQFEFFRPLSWMASETLEQADLVTMVKFLSAVQMNRTSCARQLINLFCILKPGTLVLLIDNTGGGLRSMVRHCATVTQMQLLEEVSYAEIVLPVQEQLAMADCRQFQGIAFRLQSRAQVFIQLWKRMAFP